MFDLQFAINKAVPLALSAYGNARYPSEYDLVGVIETDWSPTKTKLAAEVLATNKPFGLVVQNKDSVVVAIRGTETLKEWIEDFYANLVPFVVPNQGVVHEGFQEVYSHIRKSILNLISGVVDKQLYIVGHSLGAALAMFAALEIVISTGQVAEVYTFGGPRTFAWAGKFDSLIIHCNRVVNHGDIVPQVPLPPLFRHVGQPLSVKGGFKVDDISFAHHLTTYLNGLQLEVRK